MYTLVILKRSYCYLFCPSRVCQVTKKAGVVTELLNKAFQQNSHSVYLEIIIGSLAAPCIDKLPLTLMCACAAYWLTIACM